MQYYGPSSMVESFIEVTGVYTMHYLKWQIRDCFVHHLVMPRNDKKDIPFPAI